MGKKNHILNNRQRAFVEHYLMCWNASEAARRAGYRGKNANVTGPRMLSNVGINTEIQARLSKLGMSADEVMARLAAQARGDLSPFLVQDVDEVTFDLSTEQAKRNLHLIKKIRSRTRRGTRDNGEEWEEHDTEIELYDAQAALVQIGRSHKLFVDRTESATPLLLVIDK